MFIDFGEFVKNTEEVVEEVFRFVGVRPELAPFRPLPPGMKVLVRRFTVYLLQVIDCLMVQLPPWSEP